MAPILLQGAVGCGGLKNKNRPYQVVVGLFPKELQTGLEI